MPVSSAPARRATAQAPRLTARAWMLILVGLIVAVAGELFGSAQIRMLGILLAVLPLLVWVARMMLRPKLEVERTVYPTTVAAGDRVRVVAEVRNRSVIGLEPSSYADVVTGTDREVVGGVLPAVASRLHPREGRRRRRIAYGLTGLRRGIQEIGPLLLDNVDGFGLTRRTITAGGATELEVWPSLHDVDVLDVPALRTGDEEDAALGRAGAADDVVTREYRRGDALRRVHWRATARAGELRVRQEEHHSEVVATVVLDVAEPVQGLTAIDAGFELAISVAASVLQRLHDLGYDTTARTTKLTLDRDEEPLDATQVTAHEPLGRLMRRFMLLPHAAADAPDLLHEIGLDALKLGRGPFVYIGRTDTPAEPRIHDLVSFGSPAIAVLIGAGATERAREFAQAGWETRVMDAADRDPWARVRKVRAA